MATRSKKDKPDPAARATSTAPNPFAAASSSNIWLAGLGALAQAQADAQAKGSETFEALVRQGMQLQEQTQELARKQWAETAERLGAMASQATGGGDSWNRLSSIFEGRVARALGNMGMPTAAEIGELRERIDRLEHAMAQLQGSTQPKAGSARTTTRSKSSKSHK